MTAEPERITVRTWLRRLAKRTLIFWSILILGHFALDRGCRAWTAGRLDRAASAVREGRVSDAVPVFVIDYKRDVPRDSRKAFRLLIRLRHPEALPAMIDLMDIPRGTHSGSRADLRLIAVAIRETADTPSDHLPLSPDAPRWIRAREKARWRHWLEHREREPAGRKSPREPDALSPEAAERLLSLAESPNVTGGHWLALDELLHYWPALSPAHRDRVSALLRAGLDAPEQDVRSWLARRYSTLLPDRARPEIARRLERPGFVDDPTRAWLGRLAP